MSSCDQATLTLYLCHQSTVWNIPRESVADTICKFLLLADPDDSPEALEDARDYADGIAKELLETGEFDDHYYRFTLV